jgi:hypothetical protein
MPPCGYLSKTSKCTLPTWERGGRYSPVERHGHLYVTATLFHHISMGALCQWYAFPIEERLAMHR